MLCVFISDTNTLYNMHDYIGSHPQTILRKSNNTFFFTLFSTLYFNIKGMFVLWFLPKKNLPLLFPGAILFKDIRSIFWYIWPACFGETRVREFNNWTWLIIIDLTDTNRGWTTLVHCLLSRRSLYLQHIFSRINTI